MKQIFVRFKKLSVRLKELLAKYKILILAIFMLGLVIDVLINPKISDSVVLLLIVIWILNISNLKLDPLHSLFLAAALFLTAFIVQFLGNDMLVEKSASWFFVFLSIAFIQKILGLYRQSEKQT